MVEETSLVIQFGLLFIWLGRSRDLGLPTSIASCAPSSLSVWESTLTERYAALKALVFLRINRTSVLRRIDIRRNTYVSNHTDRNAVAMRLPHGIAELMNSV